MNDIKNFDWSKFTLQISVRAETQSVYNAWAVPTALEKWLVSKAEFSIAFTILKSQFDLVQDGDCFEWSWKHDGILDGVKGKIVEANGENFLRFILDDTSMLCVTIRKENGETLVELFHKNISANDEALIVNYLSYLKEWSFYLTNLKSFLEGGIDLRTKEIRIMEAVHA
ncbi:MAG: hypothetical protein ACHQD9_05560 [Chitinophagales bacterium]